VVKRPATARVALQGWLHKQGSEGLMLWKKRWFVLSEYCLFYYKGTALNIIHLSYTTAVVRRLWYANPSGGYPKCFTQLTQLFRNGGFVVCRWK
jgi:hypothetical protein